ncbi:unnamed protein product [Gordionus sp. m RMFG-2023]
MRSNFQDVSQISSQSHGESLTLSNPNVSQISSQSHGESLTLSNPSYTQSHSAYTSPLCSYISPYIPDFQNAPNISNDFYTSPLNSEIESNYFLENMDNYGFAESLIDFNENIHIFEEPTFIDSQKGNSLLFFLNFLYRYNVKGCFFHFTQAIWRKVQHLGVVKHFLIYMDTTWINSDAIFPHQIWTRYKIQGPRNNNHLEGYHHSLKRMAKNAHPDIYSLIRNTPSITSQLSSR